MDPVTQTLELIEHANRLEQKIIDALSEGDSATAESCCARRQRLIEEIPFSALQEPIPDALLNALGQLLESTKQLTALTENIQREIGAQLSQVKKGIVGSQAYRNIDLR